MKTDHEANAIATFCVKLNILMCATGNYCAIHYNNESEMVIGSINNEDIRINVGLSSITASARDIIRGIARVLDDKY